MSPKPPFPRAKVPSAKLDEQATQGTRGNEEYAVIKALSGCRDYIK